MTTLPSYDVQNALCGRGLTVTAGTAPILQGVNLTLPKGKLLGLIGPNGAGKSTLLKAVLGLRSIDQGKVTIDGQLLDQLSARARAHLMAYAAQGAPVHWPLTAEHIVALGRIPHLDPWQKISSADMAAIESAMKETDSLHLRDRVVTTLSGGERACVLLARAIVTAAPYLLADEPVAALDPYHQLQVMDILRQRADMGQGVLIVLHDLSLARRFCDELLLLNKGQVLAYGSPEDVLTADNLEKAYNIRAAEWQREGEHFLVPWRRGDATY